MKNVFIALILVALFSCGSVISSESSNKVISISEFPKSWVKLTKNENELVIYQPCDASNSNFWIAKTKYDWILAHEEGHETTFDTIVKIEKGESGYSLFINPEYGEKVYAIQVSNFDSTGTSIWQWEIDSILFEGLFLNISAANSFELVVQPCRECWDDYICDEKELDCSIFEIEKHKSTTSP